MAKHSPLPWSMKETCDGPSIVDAVGNTVCDQMDYYPYPVSTEDQELILKAVNAMYPPNGTVMPNGAEV
jgi:hypothetical protein